jgi:hypothetical protein
VPTGESKSRPGARIVDFHHKAQPGQQAGGRAQDECVYQDAAEVEGKAAALEDAAHQAEVGAAAEGREPRGVS